MSEFRRNNKQFLSVNMSCAILGILTVDVYLWIIWNVTTLSVLYFIWQLYKY